MNAAHRPAISLIIPAYNEEAYLPACLNAVMQHAAGKAIEIIVVDNNSTDGTKKVIEGYPGVTYLFEPTKGIHGRVNVDFSRPAGKSWHT